MQVPEIIGLCGIIGSGKDTTANIIKKHYGHEQMSFSETLKDVLSPLFGWDRDLLEGKSEESRLWREQPDKYWSKILGKNFTPRQALQEIGTELFRDKFDKNIWCNSVKKKILDEQKSGNIIFSDCRFPNEIAMIKELGGTVIEIQPKIIPCWYNEAKIINSRPDSVYTGELSKFKNRNKNLHESEFSWIGVHNPDHVLTNNGSIDDLTINIVNLFR